MKKNLIEDLSAALKPLIDSGVLKIKQEKNIYKVVKIEGSFDYLITVTILFDILSLIRNHIEKLNKYGYIKLLKSRNLLQQLDDEVYLVDKLIHAFLKALALTPSPNLNSKQLWQIETQFLIEGRNIMTGSANNLLQNINESHIRTTIFLALLAIIISTISLFY